MKETTKLRRYISSTITAAKKSEYFKDGELDIGHCWFNTYKTLTEAGIKEIKDYMHTNSYIHSILVINNIESTRPQRTWGSLPEWIRPDSMFNSFDNYNHDNTFVLVIFDEYSNEEIELLLSSIPKKGTYELINKEEIV